MEGRGEVLCCGMPMPTLWAHPPGGGAGSQEILPGNVDFRTSPKLGGVWFMEHRPPPNCVLHERRKRETKKIKTKEHPNFLRNSKKNPPFPKTQGGKASQDLCVGGLKWLPQTVAWSRPPALFDVPLPKTHAPTREILDPSEGLHAVPRPGVSFEMELHSQRVLCLVLMAPGSDNIFFFNLLIAFIEKKNWCRNWMGDFLRHLVVHNKTAFNYCPPPRGPIIKRGGFTFLNTKKWGVSTNFLVFSILF